MGYGSLGGGDRERGLNVGLDALLFVAAKARATEEGGGDYISEQEPFLTASQLRISVRQDGRRGGRGGMAAQMREGEHKHTQNTERQAGRQACIRASSSLFYVLRYSVSLYTTAPRN